MKTLTEQIARLREKVKHYELRILRAQHYLLKHQKELDKLLKDQQGKPSGL